MKYKATRVIAALYGVFVMSLPLLARAQLYVQWQATLGGTNYEECTALYPTDDGGCVIAGGSQSPVSGNKTAPFYLVTDYWSAKLDADGNKLWDKSYGGSGNEYPNGLEAAADGGFVLGGHSASGVSGNKSSAKIGFRDYWLVKTDTNGNKLWDMAYGGTLNDTCWSLAAASNGFLLAGATFSGVSGNKTAPLIGGDDWWVVMVDTNGVKQWDMAYGGTSNDYCYWAEATLDGGFLLVGESESLVSGNKTLPRYGSNYDGWVVKIDGSGNKQWEQVLGGTGYEYLSFAIQTGDGGYLVGGSSYSSPGGNKTSPNRGGADWWLIRLDAAGNKLWDQSYGGAANDWLKGVLPYDGGYLVYGTSWSDTGGNKNAAKFGFSDYWLIKVDTLGNKEWEMVFGGLGTDYAVETFKPSSDGGFFMGGYSDSIADGNKTVASYGDFDYWVVKLVPAPMLTIAPAGPGQNMVSWMPVSPGWVLQETSDLTVSNNWINSPSVSANPVMIPAANPVTFYRLSLP